MKRYSYLALILCIFITACSADKKNIQSENRYVTENKKDKDIERIKWKFIHSIDSLMAKDENRYGYVLFLFNFYDCGSCVDAGFYISKKIDQLFNFQIVKAVGSMINPEEYQSRNEYYEYIYFDEKDLIRRELKYIPTPCLLLMSKENQILDAFFPIDTLSKNYRQFIQDCIKIYPESKVLFENK